MRAVVTGGAGFVGSTLVDALVTRGASVLVIDDLSRGSELNLATALRNGAELATIDIRRGAELDALMSAFAPDTVFHMAAQIDVRASMSDPVRDAEVNVLGTLQTLQAAQHARARRVIFSSTGGALYGDAEVVPTPETAETTPTSGYGLSKLAAERYAEWFHRSGLIEVVTLRYGNVYGPRQDPRGDAGVIALFCDAALAGRPPTIFGDGLQTRDFVFVDDIIEANLRAADAQSLPFLQFNVGTGHEITLLELHSAVAEAVGLSTQEWRPLFDVARIGEVRRSCLDVSRAQAHLRLPKPTPLAVGIATTIEWVKTLRGAPTLVAG